MNEINPHLFERRIKFIELIILTITALAAMISFTKASGLICPIAILSFDLLFIISTTILGSNKFFHGITLDVKCDISTVKGVSYQLNWQDTLGYIIYGLSILFMIYILY